MRQVHAHPSRRQSNSLCLRHVHSGVISVKQGGVHALRLEVGNELLCDGGCWGVFAGEGGSKLCVHRGSGALEDGSGREFADYGAVDGAQLRWRGLRHCVCVSVTPMTMWLCVLVVARAVEASSLEKKLLIFADRHSTPTGDFTVGSAQNG